MTKFVQITIDTQWKLEENKVLDSLVTVSYNSELPNSPGHILLVSSPRSVCTLR
jgi:hypothetical protein